MICSAVICYEIKSRLLKYEIKSYTVLILQVVVVLFVTAASSCVPYNYGCRLVIPEYSAPPRVQHNMASFMSSWNFAATKVPKILTMFSSLSNSGRASEFIHNPGFRHICKQFVAAWNKAAKNAPTLEEVYNTFILTPKKEALVPTLSEFLGAWEAAARRMFVLNQLMDNVSSSKKAAPKKEIKKYALEFIDAWDTCEALLSSLQTSMYQLSGLSPLPGVQTMGTAPQFLIEMGSIDEMIKKSWDNAMADLESNMEADIFENLDTLLSEPVHYIPDITSKFNKGIKAASAAFMAPWNNAVAKGQLIEFLLGKPGTKGQFILRVPQEMKVFRDVQIATDDFISAWEEAQNHLSILEKALILSPEVDKSSEKIEILTSAWQAAMQWLRDLQKKVAIYTRPKMAALKRTKALEDIERIMSSFVDSWDTAKGCVHDIQPFLYEFAEVEPSPASSIPDSKMPLFIPAMEKATDDFMKAWSIAAADFPDMDEVLSSIKIPNIPDIEMPDFGTQKTVAKFMAAWNNALAKANTIQSRLIRLEDEGRISVKVPDQIDLATSIQEASEDFTDAWKEAETNIAILLQLFPNFPKKVASSLMHHWEMTEQWLSVIQRRLTIYNSPEYGASEKLKASKVVTNATYSFVDSWTKATEKIRVIYEDLYKLAGMTPPLVPVGIAPVFAPTTKQSGPAFQDIWDRMSAKFDDFNEMMNEISIPKVPVATAPLKIFSLIDKDQSVQKATTDHMASWNVASQSIDKIHKTCLKSMKKKKFAIPTEESERKVLLGAINTLLAAYDAAFRRIDILENVILDLPEEEDGVEELKRNVAEYLYAWNTAAKRVLIIKEYLTTNPYLCETCFNKKIVPGFFSACHEASLRIPKIETALYALSGANSLGPCAACLAPAPVSETPKITAAKRKYVDEFNESMSKVPKIKDAAVLPVPSKFFSHVKSYSFAMRSYGSDKQLPNRLFAPLRNLPMFVKCYSDC